MYVHCRPLTVVFPPAAAALTPVTPHVTWFAASLVSSRYDMCSLRTKPSCALVTVQLMPGDRTCAESLPRCEGASAFDGAGAATPRPAMASNVARCCDSESRTNVPRVPPFIPTHVPTPAQRTCPNFVPANFACYIYISQQSRTSSRIAAGVETECAV